jgi:hypothetical protein
VFHQGDATSVYMQNTSHDMLLLVVFGKDSNPGLVRLYSSESCQTLDERIAEADSAVHAAMPVNGFEIDETKQPFQRAPKVETS